MESLLISLGFVKNNKGRTSGSAISFVGANVTIYLHKPHPRKELKTYQILAIIKDLKKEGLI